MNGLGKARSRFGKWIDQHSISQKQLSEKSGISRNTISRLANTDDLPSMTNAKKILETLRSEGYDVQIADLWNI
jgi:transcriptional regulator with XRE-family HTH domain